MSMDESLQVSGRVWHAFAVRNRIAAATHAANTGDHGDHAAAAFGAKTDRCRKN